MCDIAFENIGGASCEPVGGISTILHYAKRSDFLLLNDPPQLSAVGALATKAAIATAHTFPAEKGFFKLEAVVETVKLESPMIGEKGRRLFNNKLTLKVSGSSAALLGFQRAIKNENLVILAEEVGSGQVRQLGSKRFPATIAEMTGVIEETQEGDNSLTITFEDKQPWPAPIYSGDITLAGEGS